MNRFLLIFCALFILAICAQTEYADGKDSANNGTGGKSENNTGSSGDKKEDKKADKKADEKNIIFRLDEISGSLNCLSYCIKKNSSGTDNINKYFIGEINSLNHSLADMSNLINNVAIASTGLLIALLIVGIFINYYFFCSQKKVLNSYEKGEISNNKEVSVGEKNSSMNSRFSSMDKSLLEMKENQSKIIDFLALLKPILKNLQTGNTGSSVSDKITGTRYFASDDDVVKYINSSTKISAMLNDNELCTAPKYKIAEEIVVTKYGFSLNEESSEKTTSGSWSVIAVNITNELIIFIPKLHNEMSHYMQKYYTIDFYRVPKAILKVAAKYQTHKDAWKNIKGELET